MPKTTEVYESVGYTNLLEDLPISKETTSSRVIVNNQILRVVLFAFDTGEQLTEHSTPRAVICQLLSGAIDFTVADTVHHLAPGDLVYLAPGQKHALVANEPSYLTLVMVDTDARLDSHHE